MFDVKLQHINNTNITLAVCYAAAVVATGHSNIAVSLDRSFITCNTACARHLYVAGRVMVRKRYCSN